MRSQKLITIETVRNLLHLFLCYIFRKIILVLFEISSLFILPTSQPFILTCGWTAEESNHRSYDLRKTKTRKNDQINKQAPKGDRKAKYNLFTTFLMRMIVSYYKTKLDLVIGKDTLDFRINIEN